MLEPRMENSGYEWWSQNWGHLPAATLHRTTPAWPSSGGEGADFGWNGSRVFEIEKNTSQQVGRAFFMNSFKRTRHFDEPQIWSLWKKKKKSLKNLWSLPQPSEVPTRRLIVGPFSLEKSSCMNVQNSEWGFIFSTLLIYLDEIINQILNV